MSEIMRNNTTAGTVCSGWRQLAGRKIIKCPHCREFLMDVDRFTKVELFNIPTGKHKSLKCEEYTQWAVCGGTVGYNLIKPSET